MPGDFLNNSLHDFLSIGLSEHLLKVHDVTHHFCMERDRALHPLLKFKVRVMEEVFIGLFESGLVCHMVETLSNGFRHSL